MGLRLRAVFALDDDFGVARSLAPRRLGWRPRDRARCLRSAGPAATASPRDGRRGRRLRRGRAGVRRSRRSHVDDERQRLGVDLDQRDRLLRRGHRSRGDRCDRRADIAHDAARGVPGRAIAIAARTSGWRTAADRSTARILACGDGERRIRPWSMPGRTISTVKRVAPVTLSRAFSRGIGLPITASSALGPRAGGSSSGIRRSISPSPTLAIPLGNFSTRSPGSPAIVSSLAPGPPRASRRRHADRFRIDRDARRSPIRHPRRSGWGFARAAPRSS